VKAPDRSKYDLRSLRFVHTGGAPVPVELINAFREEFGCRVLEGFGQTESSAVISFSPYYGSPRIGMAGTPLRGIPVRLVDENDVDLPTGEIGEIICQGPVVMKGYWKMPEATAQALRGGWLHTGDLGRMDEDGYIQIVGRLKEMIITGGFNIYPKELEEVIYTHPAVLEAAVVGVPDEAKGEVPKAFVALKPGHTMTEQEFFHFCRGQLAAYKVPRQVQFVESLPKTPTGKITKVELQRVQDKSIVEQVRGG